MPRKAVRIETAAQEVDQYFGDWAEAVVNGTPLACALIATSLLENALMTLLVGFFEKGSTTEGLFKNSGILCDLSRCTQMAYCIGLIPKQVKANLETVADIRNIFAHSTKLIDFDNADIASLCGDLALPKGVEDKSNEHAGDFSPRRYKFTLVCGLLSQHLIAYVPLYAEPLAVCRRNLKRPVEW